MFVCPEAPPATLCPATSCTTTPASRCGWGRPGGAPPTPLRTCSPACRPTPATTGPSPGPSRATRSATRTTRAPGAACARPAPTATSTTSVCPARRRRWARSSRTAAALTTLLALATWLARLYARTPLARRRAFDAKLARVQRKLRILIGFVQVASQLHSSFPRLRFPLSFVALLNWLPVLAFDLFSVFGTLGCVFDEWSYHQELLFATVWPALAVGLPAALGPREAPRASAASTCALPELLVFPKTSTTVFAAFRYDEVGMDATTTTRWLRAGYEDSDYTRRPPLVPRATPWPASSPTPWASRWYALLLRPRGGAARGGRLLVGAACRHDAVGGERDATLVAAAHRVETKAAPARGWPRWWRCSRRACRVAKGARRLAGARGGRRRPTSRGGAGLGAPQEEEEVEAQPYSLSPQGRHRLRLRHASRAARRRRWRSTG